MCHIFIWENKLDHIRWVQDVIDISNLAAHRPRTHCWTIESEGKTEGRGIISLLGKHYNAETWRIPVSPTIMQFFSSLQIVSSVLKIKQWYLVIYENANANFNKK